MHLYYWYLVHIKMFWKIRYKTKIDDRYFKTKIFKKSFRQKNMKNWTFYKIFILVSINEKKMVKITNIPCTQKY